MLQGSCPLQTAPFFTLHILAGINSLWLLSALELLNLELAYRKKRGATSRLPLSTNVSGTHSPSAKAKSRQSSTLSRKSALASSIVWCVISW